LTFLADFPCGFASRWWSALALAACTPGVESRVNRDDAGLAAVPSAAVVSMPPAAGPSTPSLKATFPPSPPSLPPGLRFEDASTFFCRPIRGPIELPIRGPAALVPRGDRIDAVLDENGRPHTASFVAGPVSSTGISGAAEVANGGPISAFKIPCVTTGSVAFCPDRSGAIHRTTLTGEEDRIVANSRTGTRVAAGTLGGTHTALAYLASRQTSEGWVSEAWLEVDEDPPVRLSEDGCGATAVNLASHGSGLVALTVDARAALTAMHARPIIYDRGLRLGEDAVVFVGGPGDRHTAAVMALPPAGPGWAFLPIAKDAREFGLALVRLDDPPRVDEPTLWSMYPNGLDPAPIAAAQASGRTWVARVRPREASPGAPRDLELGEVTPEGTFIPRYVVPTADSPSDVSLTLDPRGALWVGWLDSSGSWLERFACRP
jgi:hypothetical protein